MDKELAKLKPVLRQEEEKKKTRHKDDDDKDEDDDDDDDSKDDGEDDVYVTCYSSTEVVDKLSECSCKLDPNFC